MQIGLRNISQAESSFLFFHAIIPTWKNLPTQSSLIRLSQSGLQKALCFFWVRCLHQQAEKLAFIICTRKTDSGEFFRLFLVKRFHSRTTHPTQNLPSPNEKILFYGTILPFGMFSPAVRLRERQILQ